MLETNPALTWRAVKHILTSTFKRQPEAIPINPSCGDFTGVDANSAGYHASTIGTDLAQLMPQRRLRWLKVLTAMRLVGLNRQAGWEAEQSPSLSIIDCDMSDLFLFPQPRGRQLR